jgi:AcrR family transcriptional regulator
VQAAIARTGPEGLRLHDIAAAAGISHPLILHHFGSRAGLVRGLTREAIAELKDKLVAAMTERDYTIEEQLDRVFDAFRNGLGQRLAGHRRSRWRPERLHDDPARDRRPPARPPDCHGAAWHDGGAGGQPISGPSDRHCRARRRDLRRQFRRSAGLEDGPETDTRFRAWLAALIRARTPLT